MIIIGIIITIGIIAFFGYCILCNTGMNEEERRLEDEEQIEWIRKWKEKNEKADRDTKR